jgi:hypothetical protein
MKKENSKLKKKFEETILREDENYEKIQELKKELDEKT